MAKETEESIAAVQFTPSTRLEIGARIEITMDEDGVLSQIPAIVVHHCPVCLIVQIDRPGSSDHGMHIKMVGKAEYVN